MIAADVDGNDIWVGTAKGLGWGIGEGYYPGTKERPLYAYGQPVRSRAAKAAEAMRSRAARGGMRSRCVADCGCSRRPGRVAADKAREGRRRRARTTSRSTTRRSRGAEEDRRGRRLRDAAD